MEYAKTSGMPDVVSGSCITVDPLDLIIFLMPSWVQMMLTKFIDVKSIPSIMDRCSASVIQCIIVLVIVKCNRESGAHFLSQSNGKAIYLSRCRGLYSAEVICLIILGE